MFYNTASGLPLLKQTSSRFFFFFFFFIKYPIHSIVVSPQTNLDNPYRQPDGNQPQGERQRKLEKEGRKKLYIRRQIES